MRMIAERMPPLTAPGCGVERLRGNALRRIPADVSITIVESERRV
jgi:hypothetical protein